MKKDIQKYAKEVFNCSTHYSGKQRVMFIRGDKNESAMAAIRAYFSPSFLLRTTKCLFIIGFLTILFASCATDRSSCSMAKGFVGVGGNHPAGMRH